MFPFETIITTKTDLILILRCIKKWLTSTNAKQGYCPQCKAKAKLTDVRDHYCRGIKVRYKKLVSKNFPFRKLLSKF